MIFFRVTNFFLNYLSKRALVACVIAGVLLFFMAFFGEMYIAKQRGTDFDDNLETWLLDGLLPCLLIPFMIYLVFLSFTLLILVLRFRESVFAGITGMNEFLFRKLIPDIKVGTGEQTGYEQRLARVKVRDRFKYTAHVIITDKGIYLHGGLMKINRLFRHLAHSYYADNGLMHFSFSDIETVKHQPTAKKRTYRVILKNKQWFEIILPKKEDSTELDGDAFSEIYSLFREKAGGV